MHVKYPLLSSDFNQTWIFWADFRKKKPSNVKIHNNPSNDSRVVCSMQMKKQTSRRTDKHDETNNRYSQFCERAKRVLRGEKYGNLHKCKWYVIRSNENYILQKSHKNLFINVTT
jgi:hypothetical protein